MENVLEIAGLCKKYDDFELKDVTFSVPKGSILGFIGQNGAGKTTTIYSLLNIIKPDSGNIKVFGKDNVMFETEIKESVGVVFDEMGFHDTLSPRQLNHMMKHIYANWQEETFEAYLKRFGLPLKKKCGNFSRGMRMKLQIAVALSHDAKLLIMDEPTSGLDPIVRNEILDIFQEFVENEEHTIMLSSHIISDLERIADEIVFINNGRIILSGNKDDLIMRHGIIKCPKGDEKLVDDKFIVAARKSSYGVQILVNDRESCLKKYPDMVTDKATLEEIMIYYAVEGK